MGLRAGGEEKARAHSPGPPQLWGAPAPRSTAEDKERLSGEAVGSSPCTEAAPKPSPLPGHSCQGLALRGRPGLPSLLSAGGPLGGLSAPGHSSRRGSEEGKGQAVRRGREARMGQTGEFPSEFSRGTQPGQSSAHSLLSPQPHPCSSFAPSSGDPIPTLASSFLQKEALVGPSQSNFPDRRVRGGGGARRGTICPCCSCALHPRRGHATRTWAEKAGSEHQLCRPREQRKQLQEQPGLLQAPSGVEPALLPSRFRLSQTPSSSSSSLGLTVFQTRKPFSLTWGF